MKEELLKGLSEEQIAKFKDCKSQEELLALAKEEGVELNEEQLEAVSGGRCSTASPTYCRRCGARGSIIPAGTQTEDGVPHKVFKCTACGYVWAPNLVD